MKKNIAIGVAIIIILGIGYWLVSPLFVDKKVHDSFSEEIEAEIAAALLSEDMNLSDQLKTDEEDDFMDAMKEAAQDGDHEMNETMPDAPSIQIPYSGQFIDVAHHGSGEAQIVFLSFRPDVVRLVDLDVLNGPDLRVLLSKEAEVRSSADLGEYIELGALKGNKGTQNYEIPEETDVSEYKSVVIYCKPFKVVFNSASLHVSSADTSGSSVSTEEFSIVDGWLVESGDLPFELIDIYIDGRYHTYLHDLPFEAGYWTYEENELTLTSDIGKIHDRHVIDVFVSEYKITGSDDGIPLELTRIR